MPQKSVAVVGAGPAGICAAKHMLEAGYDVTVFEAGSRVGGLWAFDNDNGQSQAYRNLCIITPKKHTHFSDWDFAPDTPRFPTHWDMHRYMSSYADHFGVTPLIRFKSRVASVRPERPFGSPDQRWRVVLTDGSEYGFDAVLVATGHLNAPSHDPSLRDRFAGEYLHSHEYRDAVPFARKRVCVVGTGNSGVDIASDVCPTAARTVLVARSGVRIQPKIVLGVPFPNIAIGLRKPWVPNWIRTKILTALVYIAHGDQSRLGFKTPTGRQHPTSSESIVSHIDFNRVTVKPGIASIEGQTVTFEDGTTEEFDVLVAATGYRVSLPFVPEDVVKVEGNHVDLYKRIFPVGWSGLYFLGMLNPLISYSRVFEEQSRLIALDIAGMTRLPSDPEVMRRDIRDRMAAVQALYTKSPRHELEEPDVRYFDQLNELKDPTIRNKTWPEVVGELRTREGRRPAMSSAVR